MTDLAFVEDYDNTAFIKELSKSTEIIALTPRQAYRLEQNEVHFSIPEDYYIWEEDEDYANWFKKWLIEFNDLIANAYPEVREFNIPITYHCLTLLKNVMDAFIRSALQYFKIIEIVKPKEVCYLGINSADDIVDDNLWFQSQLLYYKFFALGKQWLTKVEFKREDNKETRVHRLLNYLRFLEFIPSIKSKTILFAGPMANKIRQAKLNGYKTRRLPPAAVVEDYKFYAKVEIPKSLFTSIDDHFNFEPSFSRTILHSRLFHFVNNIVPRILGMSHWYCDFFDKNPFSCIVFDRRNHLYQYAALIAAKKKGMKTIYCRHGWDAYDDKKKWSRGVQRLLPFDYFVCPVNEDVEEYKELGMIYNCKVI